MVNLAVFIEVNGWRKYVNVIFSFLRNINILILPTVQSMYCKERDVSLCQSCMVNFVKHVNLDSTRACTQLCNNMLGYSTNNLDFTRACTHVYNCTITYRVILLTI